MTHHKKTVVYSLNTLLVISVSVVAYLHRTPHVRRQGESLPYYYNENNVDDMTFGPSLFEITRARVVQPKLFVDLRTTKNHHSQLIYQNRENILKNKNDVKKLLLEESVHRFHNSKGSSSLTVSVVYERDVYEVTLTQSEFNRFINKKRNEKEKAGILTSKYEDFFSAFGRIYF